jgi:hypothetical protein
MSQVEHKETIYIQDQITAKPGKAKEVLAAYMERYAPAAKEERGMTLVSRLITPPMWLNDQDDQGNTLFITWSVQGAPAWWNMSFHGRRNPKVAEFWQSIEPLIEKRHRCFLSDIADVESLCNV